MLLPLFLINPFNMHGKNQIGFALSSNGELMQKAVNPATGQFLSGDFINATDEEIELTMERATAAFAVYNKKSAEEKALFLEAIADEILALGDALVRRASSETALPEARIIGERGRTMGQLKAFASHLREGSWKEARIDLAQPDRQPLPKPDIRKMLVPVGPVVVFAASNFPLAFSTAGGDTASALAAGNPVIVKAHGAHLGTSQLVADAICRAAKKTGMPDGVFSNLNGKGYQLGTALVKHPKTKSVAFTGSLSGGMALHKTAQERAEPIPVFAEMGSINPVVMLPKKMDAEAVQLADVYAGSITLGVGQFCTNPGLIVALDSPSLNDFIAQLSLSIKKILPASMLNENVYKGYVAARETALAQSGVTLEAEAEGDTVNFEGRPTVTSVSGEGFLKNTTLQEEVFGPYSLVIRCSNKEELLEVLQSMGGQLTSTVMATEADVAEHAAVIEQLGNISGRLIFNGVPTGVEVCSAMQHGGPFPASTDGRFTSVGTDAILRFVRPLSYQNCPQSFLPEELKDNNPLQVWRVVDGVRNNGPI